jgi:hypothetical protein
VLSTVPGGKVQLDETVPAARTTAVIGHRHEVYLIGDYEKQKNIFISREPRSYTLRAPAEDFKNLPHNNDRLAAGAIDPYTIRNPRENGYEYEIEPLHVGIFQITASWQVSDDIDTSIKSQPIILIVRPPAGEGGKPLFKDIWLPK